jgi:hypothetical protein
VPMIVIHSLCECCVLVVLSFLWLLVPSSSLLSVPHLSVSCHVLGMQYNNISVSKLCAMPCKQRCSHGIDYNSALFPSGLAL